MKENKELFNRTPGQVVLNKLLNGGKEYITCAGKLRKYNHDKGFFALVDEDKLKRAIANLFEGDFDTLKYSKASCVRDALEYIKIKTYIDPAKINPLGINVLNGYLRLSYDKNNKPKFTLEKHSPDHFFTYCAEVEYKPEGCDKYLRQVMNDMLDSEQQAVLLRTLASQFDIQRIRQELGRLRVLLLLGNGNNGKDTIREWVSLLFSESFTNIGLQAFRQADNGRSFGIFDLTKSKINWSSENKAIELDTCQSLKSCSTGDPIQVEEKMKQGIELKAKCALLFNINEMPKLEAQQEAILSRFAVLHFPHIFKINPDPRKNYEKQADPRLKEDTTFIKSRILPALLNNLIREFENIFVDGIDYSINVELMNDIKENTNHLIQFINETKLSECDLSVGLTASAIHERYKTWCKSAGYIEYDKDDLNDNELKYHDPSNTDKIIRNHREMGRKLRQAFPNLKDSRDSSQRKLGLKFSS